MRKDLTFTNISGYPPQKLMGRTVSLDDLSKATEYLERSNTMLRYEVVYVKRCVSTQDLAESLVKQGRGEGLLVIAESMTLGRGRHGRRWVANEGGLWFTLVLEPPRLTGMQLLSLGVASSVARSLRDLYGFNPQLKWPNDVMADDRKISGILIEGKKHLKAYILVGVGINVNNEISEDLREIAINVKELVGRTVPRIPLLVTVLRNIEDTYSKILNGEVNEVLNQWRQFTETLGKRVKVLTKSEVIEGIAYDVLNDGALVIMNSTGRKHIVYSGDVIYVR